MEGADGAGEEAGGGRRVGGVSSGPGAAQGKALAAAHAGTAAPVPLQELEHARALCPPEMLIIPLSHLQVVSTL